MMTKKILFKSLLFFLLALIDSFLLAQSPIYTEEPQYEEKYRILTVDGRLLRLSDALLYRDKIDYVKIDGEINFIYKDTELFAIRYSDQNLPLIDIDYKGMADIEVNFKRANKERMYDLTKDWISKKDSLEYPLELMKSFGIEYKQMDSPKNANFRILKDKKNKLIKWRGYHRYLFCKSNRECHGGYYTLEIKFRKKGYYMKYTGFPFGRDSFKKYFVDDFAEPNKFYDFGIKAYVFQVNSLLTNIHRVMSKDYKYNELKTLFEEKNKRLYKKRYSRAERKEMEVKLKLEEDMQDDGISKKSKKKKNKRKKNGKK